MYQQFVQADAGAGAWLSLTISASLSAIFGALTQAMPKIKIARVALSSTTESRARNHKLTPQQLQALQSLL